VHAVHREAFGHGDVLSLHERDLVSLSVLGSEASFLSQFIIERYSFSLSLKSLHSLQPSLVAGQAWTASKPARVRRCGRNGRKPTADAGDVTMLREPQLVVTWTSCSHPVVTPPPDYAFVQVRPAIRAL
jgi:hypothetical protein